MTLPTPPATSHRDKENRSPNHVAWSPFNQYHTLSKGSPPKLPAASSTSKILPIKSILKKQTHILAPCEDEKKRHITPEPSDPLTNLTYLEYPVSKIIASGSSLRDLIEGYFVLSARLKNTVSKKTDADTSWSLFQPLRRNRDALAEAIIRDVGRALINPLQVQEPPKEPLAEVRITLPSPKSSPRKKQGMSAEQVKHARDLCTTCQGAVKLLATMFMFPAVYKIFKDDQLQAILNRVLDIPMAENLPTPNSRKTYGLTIWFLQVQRLPSEVLLPAADRIVSAIGRGIGGELGKEGKKGAISDGLRAIQALSVYQPATFIPAFSKFMPVFLLCLASPSPQIRIQACLAVHGMVIGSLKLSPSPYRCRISRVAATVLTQINSVTLMDSALNRTLRTVLSAAIPPCSAQGPVWGLCVLANLIVLMGPFVSMDLCVQKSIASLLTIALQHRKSSVRALAYLVSRCLTWVYLLPPMLSISEVDGKECLLHIPSHKKPGRKDVELWKERREELWKIIVSMVDMGAGVATIAGLLAEDATDDEIRRVMILIKAMIEKGGQTCGDAMDLVQRFVGARTTPDFDCSKLPMALLDAMPNLLEVQFGCLVSVVRPIFERCPQVDDVRSLTPEELTTEWIFEGLIDIWLLGLANLELPENDEIPSEVVDIWIGLLKPNVKKLQDANDDEGMSRFAQRILETITQILLDENLDFTNPPPEMPTSPAKDFKSSPPRPRPEPIRRSNAALKLSLAHALWTSMRRSCPYEIQNLVAPKFADMLAQHETTLLGGTEPQDDAREQWSRLCADVLVVCDLDAMQSFWEGKLAGNVRRAVDRLPSENSLMWRMFVTEWTKKSDVHWEAASQLLVIPFADTTSWDVSDEDWLIWDTFLSYAMNQALDSIGDSTAVLDNIAHALSQEFCLETSKSVRIADLLISHLELTGTRPMPDALLDFVDDTLHSSYPPEPSTRVTSLWLIRSLTRLIDVCPFALVDQLLESLQESLCAWISDKEQAFTQKEYSYDIAPVYETAVVSFQAFPLSLRMLDRLGPLLESAFCGREDKPSSLRETFIEFWNATYSTISPPIGWPFNIQSCLQSCFEVSDTVACASTLGSPKIDGSCDVDTSLQSVGVDEEDLFEVAADLTLVEEQNIDSESEEEEIQPERPPLFDFPRRQQVIDVESKHAETPSSGDLDSFPPPPDTLASPKDVEPQTDDADQQILAFNLPHSLGGPSTPIRKSIIYPSTPLRPSKLFMLAQSILRSPASPVLASHRSTTPSRSPLSLIGNRPASGSSKKRMGPTNKENVSPLAPKSIVEDIFSESSLGKRATSDHENRDQCMSKKFKVDTGSITSTNYGSNALANPIPMDVTEILIRSPPQMSLRKEDVFTKKVETDVSSSRTTRKRKGIFLDYVEVPTLRQVRQQQRRAASFESLFTPPPKTSPRRTRSATKSPRYIDRSEDNQSGKRRKCRRSLLVSKWADDPVLTLQEVQIPGSDDSIVYYKKSPCDPPQPEQSSDDDRYEGQITPHHLISPTIRRLQESESDPPSDDSIISNSPTRDVAARRLERRGHPSINRIPTLA